jgi:mRNA-degrading endonuclease RelE of RelBE toxin-antitoxin system
MYRRVITPSAKRSLKKLPRQVREDLAAATEALEQDPYAGAKLAGPLHFLHSFHFKSRNVQYRVAYTIETDGQLVIIHFAGVRENFYEKLRRLFR